MIHPSRDGTRQSNAERAEDTSSESVGRRYPEHAAECGAASETDQEGRGRDQIGLNHTAAVAITVTFTVTVTVDKNIAHGYCTRTVVYY